MDQIVTKVGAVAVGVVGSRLVRLADSRRPHGGRCCVEGCTADAEIWTRSGRRPTDADGLTLAVATCRAHEQEGEELLCALTLVDVVRLIPRSRRATRAAAALRRANRLDGRGEEHLRASAALSGASSLTHTHALLGGYAQMQADALRGLAAALLVDT